MKNHPPLIPPPHLPVEQQSDKKRDEDPCVMGFSYYANQNRGQMKLNDVLDDLYGSEINCGIQSFWDGHWAAWLGDDMNGRVVEETNLKFEEIAPWLDEQARKHFPNSTYAK